MKWTYTPVRVLDSTLIEGRSHWLSDFESRLLKTELVYSDGGGFTYICPGWDTITGTWAGGWPQGVQFRADAAGARNDGGFATTSGRDVSGKIEFRPDGSMVATLEEANRGTTNFTTGRTAFAEAKTSRYRATVSLAGPPSERRENVIYLSRHGQQYGPYTLIQVRQMLAAGQILPNEPISYPGANGWVAAGSLVRHPAVRFGKAGSCSACSCPEFFGASYTCSRNGCGHHYDEHW